MLMTSTIKSRKKAKISFEDISYQELWQPLFQRSKPICAILVENITRNILYNYFKIWTNGSGGGVCRHFSSRALGTPLFDRSKLFVQFR